jgi:hypothetical protein
VPPSSGKSLLCLAQSTELISINVDCTYEKKITEGRENYITGSFIRVRYCYCESIKEDGMGRVYHTLRDEKRIALTKF